MNWEKRNQPRHQSYSPCFQSYDFPGNIRELQAMIFDAVSRHESGKLSLSSFKEVIQHHPSLEPTESSAATVSIETLYASLEQLPTLKESEVFLIQEAL